jgi:hypothetical protein
MKTPALGPRQAFSTHVQLTVASTEGEVSHFYSQLPACGVVIKDSLGSKA